MSGKLQSILLAGLGTGILVLLVSLAQIPFVSSCLGCLLYAGAGMFGVWHYTSTNGLTISGGQGVGIGAGAGALAAILASALALLFMADQMQEGFDQALEGMQSNPDMDQDTFDMIEGFFNSSAIYILVVFMGGLAGTVLGLIGGAIGASMFKNGPAS